MGAAIAGGFWLPSAVVLIDLVIAVTVLEGIVLAAYHLRTRRGMAPRRFLPNLGAGLALMLAVRAGLTDAGWGLVAAGLLVAGLAHVVDLRMRWRAG